MKAKMLLWVCAFVLGAVIVCSAPVVHADWESEAIYMMQAGTLSCGEADMALRFWRERGLSAVTVESLRIYIGLCRQSGGHPVIIRIDPRSRYR